jgi:hypothetical protein
MIWYKEYTLFALLLKQGLILILTTRHSINTVVLLLTFIRCLFISGNRVPGCHSEVRRLRHGTYTLVHDTDCNSVECELDSILHISCEGI